MEYARGIRPADWMRRPEAAVDHSKSRLDRHAGLVEAMQMLHDYHVELGKEFDSTPTNFFGGQTKRHIEILAASKALVELGSRLIARGADIVAEGEKA